jgi:hypothetical protein
MKLKTQDEACGLDSTGSWEIKVAGSCEEDYESSGFMKGSKYLDKLSNYQSLLKESGPWN